VFPRLNVVFVRTNVDTHLDSSSLCRLCYFLCVVPFQESLFSRLVTYTNEQPWLWAVYVIVIGLPIVLVLVFCCGSSSQVSASLLCGLVVNMQN
jgi:calnexin